MHHSPESVNARHLACSIASSHSVPVRANGKGLLTCDVITRLNQAPR